MSLNVQKSVVLVMKPGQKRNILVDMLLQLGVKLEIATEIAEVLHVIKDREEIIQSHVFILEGSAEAENVVKEPFLRGAKVVAVVPWSQKLLGNLKQDHPHLHGCLAWPLQLAELHRTLFTVFEQLGENMTRLTPPPMNKFAFACRILVAEDNPVNQKVIKGMLNNLGYSKCDLVSNGKEAVSAVNANNYSIILMDYQMPVLNGVEAAKLIRKLEQEGKKTRVPIIAVTANCFEEEKQECANAGMDGFISKPIRAKILEETIKRFARS